MGSSLFYVNGRFLTQPMSGTNRFAYELCLGLVRRGVRFVVLTPDVPFSTDYDVSGFEIKRIRPFSSHLWEQVTLPLYLWRNPTPLLSLKGLGPLFKRNQVSTIHDMSYLVHPECFSRAYRFYYRIMTPIMAKHSKRIITVSEFSKSEISSRLHLPVEKISVVYNAPSDVFHRDGENSDSTDSFILAVSSLDPRKNLSLVFEAYLKSEQKVPLYVIGDRHPAFGEVVLPENDHIRFLGRVSDAELCDYYSRCSLFVYPSLYEGFGLPPLEAMAAGCRHVVLSDIPVFKEVFGDSVHYVKTDDVDALAHCFNTLDTSSDLSKIDDFIGRYSWDKSVEMLLKAMNMQML